MDRTFAKTGVSLVDGTNTFTTVAQDSKGRYDTNAITLYPPASQNFNYDANGNLTNDGRRYFFYDGDDQLVQVVVSNAWMTDFQYDGQRRKRITRDYAWQGSTWIKTNEVRYVYDGMLVIQERDANNIPIKTYTRGLDSSGSLQGAGGIGGLLAMTDHKDITTRHYYYHSDANGNVTALINEQQVIMARYAYDPFGNQIMAVGPVSALNPYRFSSKEWHPNSGLYYYGYRFYEPNLQRWINQDPIGEKGGINLYTILINNPIINIDLFGNDVMVVREGWSPFSHRKVIIFQPSAKNCKNNKITVTEFGAKDTPKNWWSLRWLLRQDRVSTQPYLTYEWSDSDVVERYLELTLMEDKQLIDKLYSFDSGKPCTYFIIGKTCIEYADKVFHWANEIASRRTFIKAR